MMKERPRSHSDPVLKKDVYAQCRNSIAIRVVKALSGCFFVESEDRFVHRPRYKAEEAGTEIMFVDPRNTSRTCSRCGNVKDELPLTERTYRCGCCGMVMDRDRNAALNILSKGSGMRTLRQAINGQPC